MCDRVISEDHFMLINCPDRYKTQRMCDEAVVCLVALKICPGVISKMLEKFHVGL